METFLKKVADKLISTYSTELENLIVVLPNRRASLYLSDYLSQQLKKPFWSPEFYSIEDFSFHFSGLHPINQSDLLFELYNSHLEIEKSNAHDFEQFLGWAPLILKDFNDIDAYLIDAQMTFRYLSDAKRLSKWELNRESQSELEQNYLRFYANLEHYYAHLQKNLLSKGVAYNGMAHRYLCENLSNCISNSKKYAFVGFNALSTAEQKIIDHCIENHNALTIWDIDNYYIDDKNQEAGHFLREIVSKQPENKIEWIENKLLESSKEIHIYQTAGNILQTKVAGEIIEQIIPNLNNNADECVIVLANESLMIPMLNTLPSNIPDFNLTMSYPLKMTPTCSLVLDCIDGLLYAKTDNNHTLFYHQFIEKILQNPIILDIFKLSDDFNFSNFILEDLKKNNKVYASFSAYLTHESVKSNENLFEIIQIFSNFSTNLKDLLIQLHSLVNYLIKHSAKLSAFHAGFIQEMGDLLTNIEDSMAKNPFVHSLKSFKKLLKLNISSIGIPFSGEPLHGIQIMGMLETRLLDFKNVIIISANDDTLPKSTPYQSFIFYDIKRELGLPLPHENDAIFAYHFYRLLQRADNIHLIYNGVPGTLGGGEPSRFIKQLELEFAQKNSKINIYQYNKTLPIYSKFSEIQVDKVIIKDSFIMDKLSKIGQKGFSPSSFNLYQRCPMKYYFSKIIDLKEPETLETNIESNTFGNVIHNCLEKLFIPFKSKSVDIKDLEEMKANFIEILGQEYTHQFKEGDLQFGKNHLMYQVSIRYLERYFDMEIKRLKDGNQKIEILELEKELERTIEISVNKKPILIKCYGKADRIEKFDNQLIIWDYKTGNVDYYATKPAKLQKGETFINSLYENLKLSKFEKALQLLMYCWMSKNDYPTTGIQAGILALKYNQTFNLLEINDSNNIDDEILKVFEQILIQGLEELYNPDVPIICTNNKDNCRNCEFKNLCRR